MKRLFLPILSIAILILGCSNSAGLDLSTVDFTKPADTYLKNLKPSGSEEQKGHWFIDKNGGAAALKLKDDGEKSTHYSFTGAPAENEINYAGIKVDHNSEGAITSFDQKIAFVRFSFDKTKTFDLLDLLKKKLGKPAEVTTSSGYDNKSWKALQLTLTRLSSEVKREKEEGMANEKVIYPEKYIWVQGNMIYEYTLLPGTDTVGNTLAIISKKALKADIEITYNTKNETLLKYAN